MVPFSGFHNGRLLNHLLIGKLKKDIIKGYCAILKWGEHKCRKLSTRVSDLPGGQSEPRQRSTKDSVDTVSARESPSLVRQYALIPRSGRTLTTLTFIQSLSDSRFIDLENNKTMNKKGIKYRYHIPSQSIATGLGCHIKCPNHSIHSG